MKTWLAGALSIVAYAGGETVAFADPAPPPRDGSAPAVVPAVATASIVQVHIDAPQAVSLEMLARDGDWARVCTSPCDASLPAGATYRIRGAGIRNSQAFTIDPHTRTTLHVDPTSAGSRGCAIAVTVIGSLALVPIAAVSGFFLAGELIGAILICPFAAAFETVKSQQGAEYVGCLGGLASFLAPAYTQPWVWIPGIAGAAMLTGGIVWLANTPRTGVNVTNEALGVPQGAPTPLPMTGLRVPPAVIYPVLTARF